MADNVTTVPGLPDADFEKHSFPEENFLYIVQGTGADRDRKAAAEDFFEWLISQKAMTTNNRDTRVGDIQFKMEDTRGGKLLTAYILDGRTLEKPSVTGGMAVSGGLKVDSVEGTNQGQGTDKYLVLGNTTVNGDLDVKCKAILGNGLVVVDKDELKETVDGDLEVSGKVSAGSFQTSGGISADTVEALESHLGGGDYMATATCAKDTSDPTGKSVQIDSGLTISGALSARYAYERTTAATYSLVGRWNANADDHAGRILMLYNDGSVQCKVTISESPSASGVVAKRTVLLNSGNVGAFIRVGWYAGNSMFAPISFSRVVSSTEE